MDMMWKTLVDRAMNNDQDAFYQLYQLCYDAVYRTVKSMVSDNDTALDIVQDAFVKGFANLSALDDPNSFIPWMKRIAVNKTKDWYKKRRDVNFSQLADEEGNMPDFEDDRVERLPEVMMDRYETARIIEQILRTLSDEQRIVIGMYYYENMSVAEIAYELKLNENTVKSRLNYGRKKIKAKVEELERKGTKLYGLAPIPFLLLLFKNQIFHPITGNASQAAFGNVMSKVAVEPVQAAAKGPGGNSSGSGNVQNGGSASQGPASQGTGSSMGAQGVNGGANTPGYASGNTPGTPGMQHASHMNANLNSGSAFVQNGAQQGNAAQLGSLKTPASGMHGNLHSGSAFVQNGMHQGNAAPMGAPDAQGGMPGNFHPAPGAFQSEAAAAKTGGSVAAKVLIAVLVPLLVIGIVIGVVVVGGGSENGGSSPFASFTPPWNQTDGSVADSSQPTGQPAVNLSFKQFNSIYMIELDNGAVFMKISEDGTYQLYGESQNSGLLSSLPLMYSEVGRFAVMQMEDDGSISVRVEKVINTGPEANPLRDEEDTVFTEGSIVHFYPVGADFSALEDDVWLGYDPNTVAEEEYNKQLNYIHAESDGKFSLQVIWPEEYDFAFIAADPEPDYCDWPAVHESLFDETHSADLSEIFWEYEDGIGSGITVHDNGVSGIYIMPNGYYHIVTFYAEQLVYHETGVLGKFRQDSNGYYQATVLTMLTNTSGSMSNLRGNRATYFKEGTVVHFYPEGADASLIPRGVRIGADTSTISAFDYNTRNPFIADNRLTCHVIWGEGTDSAFYVED